MPDTTSQSLSEATLTEFDYLLNRYTAAAQAERPADHNFKTHRDALYAYVRRLEGIAKQREMDAKAEPMGHVLHSGHGDHYKRGPQRPSDLMHAGRYVWTPVYAHPPAAQDREPAGWLPIESAPKDGTDVIVMYMHIDTQVVHNAFYASEADGWDAGDIGWWSYEHSEVSRIHLTDWMTPTYWMPLPKEPQR